MQQVTVVFSEVQTPETDAMVWLVAEIGTGNPVQV
jgi:hypothetical protein